MAEESLGFLLNDAARLFRRALNARLKSRGVTALQLRLLLYLKRNPGIAQAALADLIEVEPITLSRMVDRLAEAQLVERRADPADRRVWRLHLLPAADPLVKDLKASAETLLGEALDGVPAAEHDRLVAIIERIRANLSRRDDAAARLRVAPALPSEK